MQQHNGHKNKVAMILTVLALTTLSVNAAKAVEQPTYQVLETQGAYSIRRYPEQLVATTLVNADYDHAGNKGFKILADYIFGNNTAPQGGNSKIKMTAPVSIQPKQSGAQTMAMAAPLGLSQQGDMWKVTFVMPSQYTMQSIPKPNNPAVKLSIQPTTTYAVIRFSGLTGTDKVAKKVQALQQWMQQRDLTPKGVSILARYNTPWTPPFLRRNEIMIAY